MTYLAPVAPPVPVPSRTPAPAILAVAESLQPDLTQGFQIDALRLRLEMERAFGGSDADGAWDWKLAYEAGEVVLVLFLRKFGRALLARAGSPSALLPILAKVAGLLPTHTRRSEEMERFQQFSTPLPMGLAALAAAQISPHDLVLDPSAGTGLVAILAEIAGGSLALNELAETRADLLRHLFPGRPVTTFDAAQIDDHLDAGIRPSVVLMNPPFSAVANVDGRATEATARHLRSALVRLVPGGRLVAITGAGFTPDAPAWAETFGRLTETAHLVLTGAVSGAAFAKHGTSFETRILIFDKCRGGERGGITADLSQPMSSDVAQLLARIAVDVPPRLELEQIIGAGQARSSLLTGISSLAARKAISTSRPAPSAPPAHGRVRIEAEDLAYALRSTGEGEATARLSDAIYETFRMQAIDITGAAPHPTKLVQSAAMASVAPPKPTFSPKLHDAVLRDGLLSDTQLETVIYAGEARAHLGRPQPVLPNAPRPRKAKAPGGTPAAAARLFAASVPVAGTLADTYLRSRGLTQRDHMSALRFHPKCLHRDEGQTRNIPRPALIAAVTDGAGALQGAHRTWLAPDGQGKAQVETQRRAMGHLLGNAVRLTPHDDILVVGEGIETMLSLVEAEPGLPVWAALSSGHLGAVLLPERVQRLYIAIDRDPAGQRAAELLSARALDAGIAVRVLEPRLGDFNDDLRVNGKAALRQHLAGQIGPEDRHRLSG